MSAANRFSRLFNAKYLPAAIYFLAGCLVLLPLFSVGYIFAPDMVFAPEIRMPQGVSNTYLFYGALHVINLVLPSMLLQKLLLLIIFVVSGLGAHRLLSDLKPKAVKDDKLWQAVPYFAGLFYIFNPFVYSRFMAGQWALLLGYSLLPWFAVAIFRFLKKPSLGTSLFAALFLLAVSIVSSHMLGVALITAFFASAVRLWQKRTNKNWLSSVAKYGVLAISAFILASSYWLAPLALGHGRTVDTLDSFNTADVQAFQTVPGELGLTLNVLLLQGFWGDEANLYLLPQDEFGWWRAPLLAMLALVLIGMAWAWKKRQRMAVIFGLLALAGFVFAVGNAGTIFAPFNNWLYAHAPFFSGYREPQKFSVLIVLAYVYFASLGVYALGRFIAIKTGLRNCCWLLLAVPVLCAPLLLWGGHGQLKTNDYPAGWYKANNLLVEDGASDKSKVLFLPWHLYMPFSFSNSTIVNPAPKFFAVALVSSQDPEMGGAHSYKSDALPKIIQNNVLPSAKANGNLATQLNDLGIKYIILAKDFDYKKYDYLTSKRGLQLIYNDPTIEIFKVSKEAES